MSAWMNRTGRAASVPHKDGVDPFEANFNMGLAQPLSRSVRLNGFATCLRLEEIYWTILERIAKANQCSVNAVLSYVDREVHLRHGGVKNFSGLIRVVCVAYLLGLPVAR
ncbi:ribbon-helix-helix domain-containing protein [Pseudomonas sp. 2835]|uniref:ribbon-helix-helix domain-containing protein n=1 Tax=Pseudomonas sp. 2835 TaxID=3156451 RepID=UPI003D1D9DE4